MARNKLSDLNNHLFAQMERLSDEELTPEQIDKEAIRSKAMIEVADQIINNAKLIVDAIKVASNANLLPSELPEQFGFRNSNDDQKKLS